MAEARYYASGMRWMRIGLAALTVFLGATFIVSPARAQTADKQINVTGSGPGDFAFTPGSIASGQSVLWENQTGVAHTATASGEFDVSIPAGSGSRSGVVQITGAPRTITYHCSIHSTMTGTLQVTAAVSTTSRPATTTSRPTATTVRAAGATTTSRRVTTTSGGSATSTTETTTLETTTTSEESTTTSSTGDIAIKEKKTGGGTNGVLVGVLVLAILGVLGGGGYAIYRLRGPA
jgi:plastocyanin